MQRVTNLESYNDERANRVFDLYPGLQGQVTASTVAPHQFSGWHKHEKQTDEFCVVLGKLIVSVITVAGEVQIFELNSSQPQTIFIEPRELHCWRSGEVGAVLIYHLSRKHDESDEFRYSADQVYQEFNYRA
jgi:dTDP-4-dehydrorhamnose 3,5-epimerase-like enzyme